MTPDERVAHCRRIASAGGRATVARHGADHMSTIGKAGFAAALAAGWGDWLALKLAPSYRAKYGRDLALPARNPAGDAARAQARRDRPDLGRCQWPGCPSPAHQRHHVDGWRVSGDLAELCDEHHTELHRRWRQSRKIWRNHDQITLRAVAISIGIGLDDETPA